jgi:hypothetical protein
MHSSVLSFLQTSVLTFSRRAAQNAAKLSVHLPIALPMCLRTRKGFVSPHDSSIGLKNIKEGEYPILKDSLLINCTMPF